MATIRVFRSEDDAMEIVASMCFWVNVLPPRKMLALKQQFWLGANATFDSWVLFSFPSGTEDIGPWAANARVWLDGATEKNVEFIGQVLLDAYHGSRNPGGVAQIGEIQVPPIPPQPRVLDIGVLFPSAWQPWPARLEVAFHLSDGQGVNMALTEQYQRETLIEALRVVTQPRVAGLLFRYSVIASMDAVPFLPWVVDRPLRAGKKTPAIRRSWRHYQDMCTLYQHVARRVGFGGTPAYYDQHSVRLAVSGTTAEDAEKNWDQIARALPDELKRLPR